MPFQLRFSVFTNTPNAPIPQVFRIYAAALGTSLDHLRTALQEVWSSKSKKSTSSGLTQATIVPVSGVGMSATAEDVFAMEILASRQG